MKVKNIHIQNFKRFTDLTIEKIPETAKMVVLFGSNGCGKMSVFEAFNYRYTYYNQELLKDVSYHKQYADVLYHINNHNVIIEGESYPGKLGDEFFSPQFRTSYRDHPVVGNDNIEMNANEYDVFSPKKLDSNDSQVISNYKILILRILDDMLKSENDTKTVGELKGYYINKFRSAVSAVFDDILFDSIMPLVSNGTFFDDMFVFEKGKISADIAYSFLSSGEKAAFDLLLDIIVNQDLYQKNFLFIDEPEIHIHTSLQDKLIEEIYNLFPDSSQLWITTHSLGVMTKAKELSIKYPGSVVFLDFNGHDFDQSVRIALSPINQVVCQKFLSVALDGLEEQLAPEIVVLCEGSLEGRKRFNFDANIYTTIFQKDYANITFISGGSSNDLLQATKEFKMLSLLLQKQSKIIRVVDRDDHSDDDIVDLKEQGFFVISRRNIESYLFDNELIRKLVIQANKQELIDQALYVGLDRVVYSDMRYYCNEHAQEDEAYAVSLRRDMAFTSSREDNGYRSI